MNINEFLWVQKYRPEKIKDVILPPELKNTFLGMVKSGNLQTMLFSGPPGLGKTTVGYALCKELDLDYLYINASEESGIDVLRNKIRSFASGISLGGGKKVVFLDEADYLNPQSTQPALRVFIEQYSNNCTFILACNFKHKVIEPLHSRCTVIEFNATKKQIAIMAEQFMKTVLIPILRAEGVKYTDALLVELIIKHAPDWRRVINEAQRYSTTGELTADVLVGLSNQNVALLIQNLKDKDFKSMRAWVANHIDSDGVSTIRSIYDALADHVQPQSIPQAVLILAEYSYKSAFMADKELNLTACLTELMASMTWK